MAQENFSQILLEQMNLKENFFQLTANSPIYCIEHPGVVKIRLSSEAEFSALPAPQSTFFDLYWNVESSLDKARQNFPQLDVYSGHPKDVYKWMQNKSPAIFNFSPLGILVLSDAQYERKLTPSDHAMALWFNYATSMELWGPQGKWTRFHERLQALFNRYNLLVEQSGPGFYRLDPQVSWIRSHGFVGDLSSHELQLTLPWDFPLSALVKLEKLILEKYAHPKSC